MGKKQMDRLVKEFLVTGLDTYDWESLSIQQLMIIMKTISSVESMSGVNKTVPDIRTSTARTSHKLGRQDMHADTI